MKLINATYTKLLFCFLILCAYSNSFSQVVSTTPPFDFGTGALGDVIISSNQTIAGGIYNYHNFTINANVTLTVTGSVPLIIKCTGTAVINGKINAAGSQGQGSVLQDLSGKAGGNGGGGGGQNGGTGGTAIVASPSSITCPGQQGLSGIDFPGSPAGSGGVGGSSNCVSDVLINQSGCGGAHQFDGPASITNTFSPLNATNTHYGDTNLITVINGTNLTGGAGGGGAGAWCTTSANNSATGGASGGGGGGAFSITAPSITMGASALLTVKGGKGGLGIPKPTGSTLPMAGGGAGAGGTILLQYHTITLPNNGTITLPGSNATTTAVNKDPLYAITFGIDYSGGSFNPGSGGRNSAPGSLGYFLAQSDLPTALIPADVNSQTIYPFVQNGALNITSNGLIPGGNISIYDLSGKLLIKEKVASSSTLILDINELVSGLYFVHMDSGNNFFNGRFIKY